MAAVAMNWMQNPLWQVAFLTTLPITLLGVAWVIVDAALRGRD